MNGYLAALLVMFLFLLRFAVPLAIIVGLGYVLSWLERRMQPDASVDGPPRLSMQ